MTGTVDRLKIASSRASVRLNNGVALIDTLVRLHSVDYNAVGLGDFGRPEGFLERQVRRWLQQWERSKTRDIPEIEDLFVAAACRSSGVGTRLLHECEGAAHRRGFDRIGLAVGVENAGARRLYERNGYVDIGAEPYWDDGAHDTLTYLVKEL